MNEWFGAGLGETGGGGGIPSEGRGRSTIPFLPKTDLDNEITFPVITPLPRLGPAGSCRRVTSRPGNAGGGRAGPGGHRGGRWSPVCPPPPSPRRPLPRSRCRDPARAAEMGDYEKQETCGAVCLKYLLFVFNCCFWLAGLGVMAVGIWIVALKSDYISLLASNFYTATAYLLVVAGAVVMVTGILGCCATFKERRNLLRLYFILLLIIFLLEILAGILAYVSHQQMNEELKSGLKSTMTEKYRQPGAAGVTSAVDKLQQEFKCCGSNSSEDWKDSLWIKSGDANNRKFPDSCCKTIVDGCGQRDHASNIYKVEGGCITKLEIFIREHLKIIGAVGIGVACVQIFGMIFTCCLYKSLKLEHY
uniref:Uncharacterized protein n=1 Tax=Ornithorhynchus anatinus TaxID=9258 RepID=A0A6I8PN09_ORNAN